MPGAHPTRTRLRPLRGLRRLGRRGQRSEYSRLEDPLLGGAPSRRQDGIQPGLQDDAEDALLTRLPESGRTGRSGWMRRLFGPRGRVEFMEPVYEPVYQADPPPRFVEGDVLTSRDDEHFVVGHASSNGLNCFLDTISQLLSGEPGSVGKAQIRAMRTDWAQRGVAPERGLVEAGSDGPRAEVAAMGLSVKVYCVDGDGKLNHVDTVGEGRTVHAVLEEAHYSPLWPMRDASQGTTGA